MMPLFCMSQAHLGSTESEIESEHSDKIFNTGHTSSGKKYIYTDFDYGTIFYYINDTTHVSDLCIQRPKDMAAVNTLVQLYNNKYVITSRVTWTAYLEGGGIMYITLKYIDDDKIYVFGYSSSPQ